MTNKLVYLALIALFALAIPCIAAADTGTYQVIDQRTNLTAQANTDVTIDYSLTMKVTGGNIPWVEFGLPNSKYDIVSYGGAAVRARHNDDSYSSAWVHLDLDKTYYSGDTFTATVVVLQKGFVQKYGTDASVQFTPNWWDNSKINTLTINFMPAPGITEIKTDPAPMSYGNGMATWTWNNVEAGGKRTIGVLMSLSAFPSLNVSSTSTPASPSSPSSGGGNGLGGGAVVGAGVLVLIFFIAVIAIAVVVGGKSSDYESPSVNLGVSEEKHTRKRNLSISCPYDNTTMEKKDVSSITANFCPVCSSLWLDAGVASKLFEAKVDEKDISGKEPPEKPEKKAVATKTCPRCGEEMEEKTESYSGTENTSYYCAACGGVLLAAGTYNLIKNIRKAQEKLVKDGTEKHERDDHWWFYWWLIMYPHAHVSTASIAPAHSYGGGSFSGGGGSVGGGCVHSSCVSCACAAHCACACACAGGHAAGCAPKNKMLGQMLVEFLDKGEDKSTF